jgi:hypothetical protein
VRSGERAAEEVLQAGERAVEEVSPVG